MKRSYNPSGGISPQEFFYSLLAAKEDCLLTKSGKVKFENNTIDNDEELTPCLSSDVVLDWLEALGGPELQEHIYRVFSKDLEVETLYDIQERINENIDSLLSEAQAATEASGVVVNKTWQSSQSQRGGRNQYRGSPRFDNRRNRQPNQSGFQPAWSDNSKRVPRQSNLSGSQQFCKFCKAMNRSSAFSHTISDCLFLDSQDRRDIAQSRDTEVRVKAALMEEVEQQIDYDQYEDDVINSFYNNSIEGNTNEDNEIQDGDQD